MITLILIIVILLGLLPLSLFLFRTLNQEERKNVETLDEEFTRGKKVSEAQDWWEKQRGKFNWSLLFAGLFAFILNSFLLPMIVADIPQYGFGRGVMGLLLQILTYMIYMGVANVFYSIGPLVENVKTPNQVLKYRRNSFNLLQAFFVIAPQIIVLILFF
jgi:uncharacterized membrane protein